MARSKADVDVKGFVTVKTTNIKAATADLERYNRAMLRMQLASGRDKLTRHASNPQFKRMMAMAASGELAGVPTNLEKQFRSHAAGQGNVFKNVKQQGASPQSRKMVQHYNMQARQIDQWMRSGSQQVTAKDKAMRRQMEVLQRDQLRAEKQKARIARDQAMAAQRVQARDRQMAGLRETFNRATITQRDRANRISPKFMDRIYDSSGMTAREHQATAQGIIKKGHGQLLADDMDAAKRSAQQLTTAVKNQDRTVQKAAAATSNLGRGWRMVQGVLARMSIAYGGFMAFQGIIELTRAGFEWTVGWARELQNVRARMTGLTGSAFTSEEAVRTAMTAGRGAPFTLEEVSKSASVFTGRGITATPELLKVAQATSIVLDQPLEQVVNNIAKLSIRSANLKRGLVQLGISWAAWEQQMQSGKSNLEALTNLLTQNQAVLSSYAQTWDTVLKNFRQNIGQYFEEGSTSFLNSFKRMLMRMNIGLEEAIEQKPLDKRDIERQNIFTNLQTRGGIDQYTKWLETNHPYISTLPYQELGSGAARSSLLQTGRYDEAPGPTGFFEQDAETNYFFQRANRLIRQMEALGFIGFDTAAARRLSETEGRQLEHRQSFDKQWQDYRIGRESGVAKIDMQRAQLKGRIDSFPHDPDLIVNAELAALQIQDRQLLDIRTRLVAEEKELQRLKRMDLITEQTNISLELQSLRGRQVDESYRLYDLRGRVSAGGDQRSLLAHALNFATAELRRTDLSEDQKLNATLRRDQAQRSLTGFDEGAALRIFDLQGQIGAIGDPRASIQHRANMADRRLGLASAGSPEAYEAQLARDTALYDLGQIPEERGALSQLGQIGVGSVRTALNNVDWGGRRNRQIEQQVEGLRRQKMELEGQIEPLTQAELIETRINELLTQRVSILGQIGSQLKQQVGNFLIRGLFGAVGAGIGGLIGGPVGAAKGFGVGFGQDIFGGFKAAEGFSGYVDEPTLFLTGEAGREYVDVTPEGEGGGSGMQINFNNARISSDKSEFIDMLTEVGRDIEYGDVRIPGFNER